MILVDRMLNFIQAKIDVVELVSSYFPEYEADGCVVCPFHEDTNPSLHISTEGKAYCHSGKCGFKAGNVVELYAKLEGMSYVEARRVLYQDLVNAVPNSTVDKYVRMLAKHKEPMAYLTGRGLTQDTVRGFKLGYEAQTKRITIPIFDSNDTCVNIRRIAMSRVASTHRAVNIKGHGEIRLYPEWLIGKSDRMVLVGGEWDALIGRQCGIPTATWTGGEGAWNKDYDWLFRDKAVFILYDNDEAGKLGAEKAKKSAKLAGACRVEVLPPVIRDKGKDLNDWYKMDRQAVLFLASDIEAEVIVREDTGLCPYCGQTLPKGFKEEK